MVSIARMQAHFAGSIRCRSHANALDSRRGVRNPRSCSILRRKKWAACVRAFLRQRFWLLFVLFGGLSTTLTSVSLAVPAAGQEHASDWTPSSPAAAEGLALLRSRAYLPADLDADVFAALPEVWEEPLRSQAAKATPAERARMAMERYGLTPDPDDPSQSLQYVVGADGSWTMSCLACHQGQVAGRAIPGVPNSTFALETLTEDVRLVKLRQGKPLGHMDIGSLLLPLGTTAGTTNAVVFGMALMHHRDKDLNILSKPPRLNMPHHDMDAPAWWHVQKKKRLYADGFAPSNHRILMQFLLVKENGPERFREWEDDFRAIESWIMSLQPPAWPGEIDAPLAEQGRVVFEAHCSECHGTYAASGDTYPERIIPIDEIGTDRRRYDALTASHRRDLIESWFGSYGSDGGLTEPEGYVPPPLDGIWATAPYFHNGSVPTLWHVLHPDERPAVWKRTPTGYDQAAVGLEVTSFDAMPTGPMPTAERRRYFDTSKPGKSAAGHDYPSRLSAEEKQAVLEYLKTL
jgi:hypothetical protein